MQLFPIHHFDGIFRRVVKNPLKHNREFGVQKERGLVNLFTNL